MADADLVPSLHGDAAFSSPIKNHKEDMQPVADKIAELNESQSELLGRLRGLKEDLQNWRLKLDTQVKTYKDELLDLKKALGSEMEQLTLDFQELRTTLQKQQDDVAASLRDLGMSTKSEKEENAAIKEVSIEKIKSNEDS
ncbi:uveal autoantigen with coiled-coil/ankyrin [Rhynchospora pubera]|uniref:Uveal autoantigen with coiled-coil/ankyrin n=1 Tax=Rhynchospora pubera TaxID=906938 RepID=A0AAV8EHG4_9POAL|nr:uveal autoantigen with coiled-coil/ankyrin [Rhynchospora pubera]